VQARDADVVDEPRAGPEDARRDGCLVGDLGVGGARRHDDHAAPRRRDRADGGGARGLVERRLGQFAADQLHRGRRQPGGEHGPIGVRLVQSSQQLHDVLGWLARAVHDLGVARACRPLEVEPGVAEVE
jgi:hypothetical protein